jgi:phosphatidylglycerol:prolipoprotein diacylglycerol transferase
LYARANKIDPLRLGDLIVAVEPIGGFFVRIANFINGELWGRPTHLPWGVIFPGAGPEPRHPSQLYEAALEGLALFLILRWATHGKKWLNRRGVVLGMFLVGYGIFRIALENVREPDSYMPNFPFGLTMGMMLSAPMVLLGGPPRRGVAPCGRRQGRRPGEGQLGRWTCVSDWRPRSRKPGR